MAAYNKTGGRGVKKDTSLPVAMWYIKDWGGIKYNTSLVAKVAAIH